jgi:hypothetical protein
MPDVARIRALAKEVGYAIGEHGSKERDLDLIAAPWVDEAVDHLTLACHIAQGINARIVDGGPKPLGRHGFNLQIDGWFKLIDLSVCPRQSAPTPTISGGEMVSVPRVATEAMIEAGWIDKEDVDPQDIWAAMVEAAPAADRSA